MKVNAMTVVDWGAKGRKRPKADLVDCCINLECGCVLDKGRTFFCPQHDSVAQDRRGLWLHMNPLRRVREARGWGVDDLAKRIESSEDKIRAWEQGWSSGRDPRVLVAAAYYLKAEPSLLLHDLEVWLALKPGDSLLKVKLAR